jgi:SpoVK/Ycf46/Vps4 family AAA+-type ATPase
MTAFTIYAHDGNEMGMDVLTEYAKRFISPPPTKKDKIHVITQSQGEFYLKDIELKERKRSKFSYDHYNEGFEEISGRVISTLSDANESGLVLFHGDAGTGKTSYLKHLLHTITTKKLIYMPPDLTEHISSPGFITFMMSEAMNSILLIEDAETVLRHREAGGNQAVANILNISDGILGDVLKLQIVCTFNSPLSDIDPALRRPGRCIAEYRFEKLTDDRAGNLMANLYGEDVEWEPKEMTLAEVFNFKKPHDVSKPKERTFGFIPIDTKKK